MDLLRWRPYSELLQDGVKDDVVGVIRVCLCYPPPPCRKLGYMQKQMGYSFFVLFFFSRILYLQVLLFQLPF